MKKYFEVSYVYDTRQQIQQEEGEMLICPCCNKKNKIKITEEFNIKTCDNCNKKLTCKSIDTIECVECKDTLIGTNFSLGITIFKCEKCSLVYKKSETYDNQRNLFDD